VKRNRIKKEGFTLLEVIISIAIIGILSVSIYNGYMIIIKQTKAGQVKQSAALEGKKMMEEMKATSFLTTITDGKLNIGDIELEQDDDDESVFIRYLDKDFSMCAEEVSKYIEKLTLTSTNVTLNDEQITDELKNSNNINYKVYIGRQLNNTTIEDYIKHQTTDSPINLSSDSNKISMYVYFETPSDSTNDRTITIKDSKGITLVETTETLTDTTSSKVNLCVNFDNYKKVDSSNLNDIELFIYNRTGSAANIYLQKDTTVSANVTVCKGEINVYDNRAEDLDEGSMGELYNIKLEISDYLKYKNDEINEDKDNLFTGYAKKNL
jgi:prepilin-type N-terminal cleavage/methylation domain-containing protein